MSIPSLNERVDLAQPLWYVRDRVSADSSRALVVEMTICEGLCGHAGFYFFDRTDTGSQVAHVVVTGES